jgi:LPP20 lipoprotein
MPAPRTLQARSRHSLSLGAVVAICATGLLAACGEPPPSVIRTSSSPKAPAWMNRQPSEPGALYFVGTKPSAESLDEGKTAAMDKARDEAAKYIGVNISSTFTSTASTDAASDSVQATDTVKSRTAALIKNAELVDVYWEKNSRIAGATTIDRWDVSVLMKLNKADLDAERKRQEDEAKATATAMLFRYREGQQLENQHQPLQALVRYRDAAAQLKNVGRSVDTGDPVMKTAGQVLQAASDGASRMQQRARTAILVGPDALAGPISQGLSKKGFSASARPGMSQDGALQAARGEGLPYVIVVKFSSSPGGQVYGQVAATVTMDVRALDAATGAVVTATQKTAKAFAKQPEAAERAAASEAGLGAGSDLAAALVAKETAGQ